MDLLTVALILALLVETCFMRKVQHRLDALESWRDRFSCACDYAVDAAYESISTQA